MLELLLIVLGNLTFSNVTTINGMPCSVSYAVSADVLTYVKERISCPPAPYYVLNISTQTITLAPGMMTSGSVSYRGITLYTAQWKMPWPSFITFFLVPLRGKLEALFGRLRKARLKHSKEA